MRSVSLGDLRYYFYQGGIGNWPYNVSRLTTVQTSSLFNEISPSVSFPLVAFFSFLFLARRSHSLSPSFSFFLSSQPLCSSFPNIFARIDDESQPAGKYTSLLNKTLSGLGAECTARINGRESSRRGYIWEKCRERIVRMYRSSRVQPWFLASLASLYAFTRICFSLVRKFPTIHAR